MNKSCVDSCPPDPVTWPSIPDLDWDDGPEPSAAIVTGTSPMFCRKCGQMNEFAEPNEPWGAYLCYECRRK